MSNDMDTTYDPVEDFNDWADTLNSYSFFMEEETGNDDFVYEAMIGTYYLLVNYPEIAASRTDEEVADAQQFLDHNAGNVPLALAALASEGWFEVILSECCGEPVYVPSFPEWMFEDDDV